MNFSTLKNTLISNGIEKIDGGKTILNCFSEIPTSSLQAGANRLNSSWIRAQYIIIKDVLNLSTRDAALRDWKNNSSVYSNQYLIIQIKDDNVDDWEWYDSKGEFLGNLDELLVVLTKLKLEINDNYSRYLTAMRTKPFLLLAGISGTGKSRIVKEMAFASCPTSLRHDDVSPGNYCMIEIKPNWHDSTELIGYESKINGDHYVVTPFINFLIKAWHNLKVPFFVCLDEMNLAPVEQYLAEFLSVLESRKLIDGEIKSEALIKPEIFRKKSNYESFKKSYFGNNLIAGGLVPENFSDLWKSFGDNGLRLPPNLIVIGTVNMDDTTYQFSRKVIDRAMTIEMNEVNFDSMFVDTADTLKYRDPYISAEYFLPRYTAAKDVLLALNETNWEYLKVNVPATLKSLDAALANTPFRIAYRVENELILYFAELQEEHPKSTPDTLFRTAIDDILMMKVLPRIEGNEDVLTDPLCRLETFTRNSYLKAHAKVEEMQTRLEANHFTSFWP